MTGVAEFSIYLLRDNVLAAAFQPRTSIMLAADVVRRTIRSSRRSSRNGARYPRRGRADRALLGDRGIMAGPLIDPNASDRVIGMLAIGGAFARDHPEDIERRFALTAAEVSRLARPHRPVRALAIRGGADAHERTPRAIERTRGGARRGAGGRPARDRARTCRPAANARQRVHAAMTEVDRAIGPELAVARLRKAGLSESSLVNTDFSASRLGEPALDVEPADVLVALVTSAMSLAVLVYGMSAIASAPVFIALHLAVLVVPAAFLRMRMRDDGELTVPVLLLVVTFAAGPVGALGCAVMALALWRQPVADAAAGLVRLHRRRRRAQPA